MIDERAARRSSIRRLRSSKFTFRALTLLDGRHNGLNGLYCRGFMRAGTLCRLRSCERLRNGKGIVVVIETRSKGRSPRWWCETGTETIFVVIVPHESGIGHCGFR